MESVDVLFFEFFTKRFRGFGVLFFQTGITGFAREEVLQSSVRLFVFNSEGVFALAHEVGVKAIERPVAGLNSKLALFHALTHTLADTLVNARSISHDEGWPFVGFGFLQGFDELVFVGAHGNIGNINITVAHGDATKVFFAYTLTSRGKLGEDVEFGSNNDFRTSEIKKFLDKFAEEISDIIGEENLVEHIVDLTADDGLKCYGTIKAKMSLFTAQMVRENVEILDEFKLDEWWWTCTPYSTPKHENASWIKCVSPRGSVNSHYYGNSDSVRPFCIVKSSIFVS